MHAWVHVSVHLFVLWCVGVCAMLRRWKERLCVCMSVCAGDERRDCVSVWMWRNSTSWPTTTKQLSKNQISWYFYQETLKTGKFALCFWWKSNVWWILDCNISSKQLKKSEKNKERLINSEENVNSNTKTYFMHDRLCKSCMQKELNELMNTEKC